MTDKAPAYFKLSGMTTKQIAELCQELQVNKSELLTLAIDRVYQAEILNNPGIGKKYQPGDYEMRGAGEPLR